MRNSIVVPAKAGTDIHGSRRMAPIVTMDSRLRGNDRLMGYSAAPARSGKAPARPARDALSTPRSVMRPVTSRAGVTSKA